MAIIKKFLTTAELMNARFDQKSSEFVTVKERIDNVLKNVDTANDELKKVIKTFKKDRPNFAWKNVKLARSEKCSLADILIDDTMNRPLNWKHVLKILKNFKQTKVMSINVYEDPARPGKFVAWDGQHTSIVLYIVSVLIGAESASNVIVPITIYDTHDKSEIRENFIALNSKEGKKELDFIALYSQMVSGVRVDGSKKPEWLDAEKKQRLLEGAGLFLTGTDYGHTTAPGAITHAKSIVKHDRKVVGWFCRYWMERKKYENRRVESKEVVMMFNFLDACKANKIKVNKIYMQDMVKIMWDTFECEFTGEDNLNVFWSKLDAAYKPWYDKTYKTVPSDFRPKKFNMLKDGTHQDTFGTTFLIHQLKKSGFTHKLPKPFNEFKPATANLW